MRSARSLCGLSFGVLLLLAGCGGPEGTSTGSSGSSTGGSDVSLTGTVTTPTSSSKSVSLGLSAGKGAESGEVSSSEGGSISASKGVSASKGNGEDDFEVSQVIVSKATTEATANSGTCTVEKLDGTVIDTCIIQSGALSGCKFDQSKIPSDGQIEIICKSGSNTVTSLCDCTGVANGSSCSCGAINASSTLTDTLLHTNIDPSANPEKKTSTFTSQYGDGTLKPKQVFKTLKEQLGLGATAGSSDGKGAMTAVLKAVKGCMATLSSFTMADMATMIRTGAFPAGCKAADSDLAGVDLTVAAPLAFKSGGATVNFFKDSTTAGKWSDTTSFNALAKYFGANGSAELDTAISYPENARDLLNQYATSYQQGSSTAFNQITQGAGVYGKFLKEFGGTRMNAARLEAAKALLDQFNFGNVSASNIGDTAKSCYAQAFAVDNANELAVLKAQAGTLAGAITGKPAVYAGASGVTAANNFFQQSYLGFTYTGATFCAADTDCPSGQTCSTSVGVCCPASGGGGGNLGIGCSCSQPKDCISNTCTSGSCAIETGVNIYTNTLKGCGAACTLTAECIGGGTCSSNICSCLTNTGGVNGASCSGDATCNSTYCGGTAGSRTCRALASGSLSDVCSGAGQCGSGLTCTSGTCQSATGPNLCIAWTKNGAGTNNCILGAYSGTGSVTSGTCGGAASVTRIPMSTGVGIRNIDITIASGACSAVTRQYNSGGSTESCTFSNCTATSVILSCPGANAGSAPCALDFIPQ